jgi:hypothetical protein
MLSVNIAHIVSLQYRGSYEVTLTLRNSEYKELFKVSDELMIEFYISSFLGTLAFVLSPH